MLKGKKSLEGKVAIITGSTSGIGEATAKVFAEEGAKVVVSGRRADQGQKVVGEIVSNGGQAIFIQTDVTKEEDIKNLVEETIKQYGKIDILFNNAAMKIGKPFLENTSEDFDIVMKTNVKGYFLASKFVLPYMLKQKSGNILMCSSVATVKCSLGTVLYSAAKGAIQRMSKNMALEFAPYGIRINELCPGFTDLKDALPQEVIEKMGAKTPIGRMGSVEECAYAALYLVSDQASYTTGTALYVDGGFTL